MGMVERQDPLSTEVQSPLMAGFSDALNKITEILNLKMVAYEDIPLTAIEISSDDKYRIYQADFGKKLWLKTPPIVVKKNDVVITDHFSIDYIGGSISFQEDFRLTENDRVSVDATCLLAESETLKGIDNRLDKLEGDTGHNKGYYETVEDLELAVASGEVGDYAFIGGTIDSIYMWDGDSGSWKDIYKAQDLSNYYTKAEVDNSVNNLQNNITANTENLESLTQEVATNKENIETNNTAIEKNATAIEEAGGRIDEVEAKITEESAKLTEEIEKKANKSIMYYIDINDWTETSEHIFESEIALESLNLKGNENIIVGLFSGASAEQREVARNALLSARIDEEKQKLYVVADGEKPEIELNIEFMVIE